MIVTEFSTRMAAVLFDMDGTLVDSDAAVARAWTRWSRARGVDLAEVARVTPGRPASSPSPSWRPGWIRPSGSPTPEDLLAHGRNDLDDITATPGAIELIAALGRWRVPHAVVTSADPGLARARLIAAAIPIPDVLVTSADVIRGKPDPVGYLLAATRLGVPAAACLVVEDTLAGVRAGLAAGALVAAVRDVPRAHLTVADLGELHRLLARTRARDG